MFIFFSMGQVEVGTTFKYLQRNANQTTQSNQRDMQTASLIHQTVSVPF